MRCSFSLSFFSAVCILLFCYGFNAFSQNAVPDKKDYSIYIVPHSHADLSWPDTPEVCTNINVNAISETIDILKTMNNFKFSEEDVFVLKEYLQRNPEKYSEIKELFDKNALECGGFYFGPSETLLGGEGLIRNLYFGKGWLKEKFGVDTDFAWNVDEPGHTLQMPQILSKAGIETFIIWKVLLRPENNLNVSSYVGPPVFNWSAPDGSSVLVTHCPDWYGVGQMLRTDNYADARKSFTDFEERQTKRYKKWNLPPVILMADGSDCTIPDRRVVLNSERWNRENPGPKAIVGSIGDYVSEIKKEVNKGNGKLMTFGGEIPCWWDGTQSVENDAFMLSRKAENMITVAEKFSAFGDCLFDGYDYQKDSINSVWQGKLWVHEHNWGGNNGIISDAVKLATARSSFRLSSDVLAGSLDLFVRNINYTGKGIPVVVFNGLSWDRTDVAEKEITFGKKGTKNVYIADNKGRKIPCQFETKSRWEDGSMKRAKITFVADVPANGYRTYYLIPGENKAAVDMTVTETKLENRFYAVEIDKVSGGIKSIFDKTAKKELLKTTDYKGNEIVAFENLGVDEAEEFTGKFWSMGDNPVSVSIKEKGSVKTVLEIKGKIIDSPVTQQITVYSELPRIDFETELDWNGQKRIQINSAYPFDIPGGKLNYEVPFGNVEFGAENPYAQACHPTVRAANNWIDLSNGDFGVTLATEVTPFDTKDRKNPVFMDARKVKGQNKENTFTLDLFPGEFTRIALDDPVLLKSDYIVQPILFRSVFSCGDSALYFTQKGKHSYKFGVKGHAGALRPGDAVRFGMEHNSPFIVAAGNPGTGKLQEEQSFFSCSSPNIIVSVIKKAEDGKGIILRLYETDGIDAIVSLKSFFNIDKAYLTNIIEENEKEIDMSENHTLTLRVGKHSIETVRLVLK